MIANLNGPGACAQPQKPRQAAPRLRPWLADIGGRDSGGPNLLGWRGQTVKRLGPVLLPAKERQQYYCSLWR
jgi:hypothetical protein